MKKVTQEAPQFSPGNNTKSQASQIVSSRPIIISAIIYIFFILVALTPLYRAVGVTHIRFFTNRILLFFGPWLPINLHLSNDIKSSQAATHIILFIAIMWLVFIVYGLSAYVISRKPARANYRNILWIIGITTLIVGYIFIITPAMLSHDIFVYVSYGRMLAYYHTNPYFVPFLYYPNDPFIPYDDWKNVLSAYGPVWETVSALASIVIRSHLDRALVVFRSIGLSAHLLNAALIALILRTMGRSPRTITLGTLLYAWNPLALEESSLGGHNDVFMITLILAGIFFYLRAEQQEQVPLWRRFLPSTLAFSLAVLVKLTAAPVLVLYIILLAIRAFKEAVPPSEALPPVVVKARIVNVLKWIVPVGVASAIIILGIYAPYWIGYSIKDIIFNFTSPPSSSSSYGSALYALIKWMQAHGLPHQGSWKYVLLTTLIHHNLWSLIGLTTLVGMLVISTIWLWRDPTARTLTLTIIVTLSAVLMVTFWFFPWYLIWLIGLIPICLPLRYNRIERALFAFIIAFAMMGIFYYIYSENHPPFGSWNWMSVVTMFFIPAAVFILFLFLSVVPSSEMVE